MLNSVPTRVIVFNLDVGPTFVIINGGGTFRSAGDVVTPQGHFVC